MAASFTDTITGHTLNLDLSRIRDAQRSTLDSLCTDLFLIVIRMREAEDLGAPAPLIKLIKYYLNLFEKNCAVIGMQAADIAAAKYALVALLDETVLSIPGPCREHWISSPLQLEYFGDNIAGEEFFRKLDKMLLEPEKMREVLAVYYICLSLGFEGKYRIFNPQEREQIIDNLGRTIRRCTKTRFSRISPHGIRTPAPAVPRRHAAPIPLWIFAAASAAAIAVTWTAARFFSSSAVDRLLAYIR